MNPRGCISQLAKVEMLEQQAVHVRVHPEPACRNCHAHSICNLGQPEKRIIRVEQSPEGFEIGDSVHISITGRMGSKAILTGYLIPFVLLISALFIAHAAGISELLSGVAVFLALVFYFLLLYLFRRQIAGQFRFTLSKPLQE